MGAEKLVSIHKRKGKLFISSISKTIAWLWIAEGSIDVLSVDDSPSDLGDAILRALQASRSEVPHPGPNDWGPIAKPLLDAVGVKSWPTFMKGASYCDIGQKGALLHIRPSENQGSRGGFQPIEGQEDLVLPVDASSEEIGLAVKEALKISEGI